MQKIYVPLGSKRKKEVKTVFLPQHTGEMVQKFSGALMIILFGTTQNFHQMALNPSPGIHIITLVDENGFECKQAI